MVSRASSAAEDDSPAIAVAVDVAISDLEVPLELAWQVKRKLSGTHRIDLRSRQAWQHGQVESSFWIIIKEHHVVRLLRITRWWGRGWRIYGLP
jgi:hypothetical protein